MWGAAQGREWMGRPISELDVNFSPRFSFFPLVSTGVLSGFCWLFLRLSLLFYSVFKNVRFLKIFSFKMFYFENVQI
jgi:hypothetical protein